MRYDDRSGGVKLFYKKWRAMDRPPTRKTLKQTMSLSKVLGSSKYAKANITLAPCPLSEIKEDEK